MAVMTQEQITLSSVTDIMTTCRYYLLQDSALAAPTKPTTYPPASPWVKTEPTYTAGSTKSLYFVDCTLFSDETFAYTDVSMSSSYEASKVAYAKAVEASDAANNAVNAANNAVTVAGNANTSAQSAATQAAAASQAAQAAQSETETAKANAATAQGTANDAKEKAEAAQGTINEVKAELKTANEEIDGLAESLETLSNTMKADYAKKGELTDVQSSLETQISQNAAEISSTAKKVSEVEVTANGAAEQVVQAKQAAQAAQNTADLAKTNAANAASAAQAAQKAADDAQDDADAAAQAASDAQAGVNSANADLALAKANLASLESRTDATEEEIAEAQAAVSAAQTAADAANAAAATAQSTANTAKTNAATAQTAANNAKTAADNAQKAADDAQDTADAVAAEAEAIKSRMTTAETNIAQNAEAISLRATKTEVAKTLEGYYTKTQTEAAIKVEADKISGQVSSLDGRMTNVEQTAEGLTVSIENSYQKGVSRGEQLVTNGNGLLGNNTNFSSWVFDGAVANNSPGSFTMAQGTKKTVVTDEFFPVSTDNEYTFSLDIKSKNGLARQYSMLLFYDADKNEIVADHHMFNNASTTTLAKDLKKGDTVIYLTDASGWSTSYSYGYYLTIWDWVNSFGYKYPAETYTRHRLTLPKTSDNKLNSSCLNKTANTITLTSAYSGATIPAGTAVSQGSDGANYKYITLSNTLVGTEWKRYTGKISGVDYSGKNVSSKFPPATAYAKVGFMWNNNGADDQIWVTNIVVTDSTSVSAAQEAANQAKTDAANAAKTATNYLDFSSVGLIIGDMTASTLGNNVLIDSSTVNIRTGETILASFGSNLIELGKNNRNATIDLCAGLGTIKAGTGTGSSLAAMVIETTGTEMALRSSGIMEIFASSRNGTNDYCFAEYYAESGMSYFNVRAHSASAGDIGVLSISQSSGKSTATIFADTIRFTRGSVDITDGDLTLNKGSVSVAGSVYAWSGMTTNCLEIYNGSTQAEAPYIYWSDSFGGKEPYIGYAKDQKDGTFLWSITGTNYQSGLAIGGGSGNLLWKGARVLTVDDLSSIGSGDYLPLSGGNITGHIYLTGAKETSSTGNTSQIVFGTSSDNHIAITSNRNCLVLNPSTSTTSNSTTGASQVVIYLNKESKFPKGIQANITGNLTGTASKATADANGNNIASTYATTTSVTTMINNAIGGAMGAYY